MNGSDESEIREMRKNGRHFQNVDAILRVPDSNNEYAIVKHALQEQSMRTCMHIFQ